MNAAVTSGDYSSDPDAVSSLRAALRRDRLAAREALGKPERERAAARIEAQLAAWLAPRRPGVLAFCWPVRNEVDCRSLALRLLDLGWRLCQPVVTAIEQPMVFRAWTPESSMIADPYGIPVPTAGESLRPDVVLIPLVAFDARGYRLGYGGGYFDRTLAGLRPRPLAVGVGFEVSRSETVYPQPHDIAMDAVVTEAGLWQGARGSAQAAR